MKKIGLLCLALVLALGALGIGFAEWTETLTITGTVATGDLDASLVKGGTACTASDTVVVTCAAEGDTGTITISNFYPCATATCYFKVYNAGTVPFHIDSVTLSDPGGWLDGIFISGDPSCQTLLPGQYSSEFDVSVHMKDACDNSTQNQSGYTFTVTVNVSQP